VWQFSGEGNYLMWAVSLFENPLGGIGIHGVLVIRNSQGNADTRSGFSATTFI
jgi:hypothetical protein